MKGRQWALVVAVLFTMVGVLLAVFPLLRAEPATYNPELAVLTATLVAVIWYTYFTYLAVHPLRDTRVEMRTELLGTVPLELQVHVDNPNRWPIECHLWIHIWVVGYKFVPVNSDFHLGKEALPLAPYESHLSIFRLGEASLVGDLSRPEKAREPSAFLSVVVRATWEDAEGKGDSGWKHWRLRANPPFKKLVIFKSEIDEYFGPLAGYAEAVGAPLSSRRSSPRSPDSSPPSS